MILCGVFQPLSAILRTPFGPAPAQVSPTLARKVHYGSHLVRKTNVAGISASSSFRSSRSNARPAPRELLDQKSRSEIRNGPLNASFQMTFHCGGSLSPTSFAIHPARLQVLATTH